MKQNLASLAVSAASGLVGGSVIVAAGFVNLQDATPGTAQTGHINIDGTGRFGSVGVGSAPTNARVQVNETGTLQGVRASTNSGIGVFGTSTSNNGGLFVTKGNSNAVVGDAQSATGVTAGGVFYNRSSNGAGVWGRQIKADGTGIGVRGSTASATGSAAFFQNENTSSSARIAGPDGSLLTSGTLPKHQYTGSNATVMVPIAYGYVGFSGNVFGAGTGNWTVTKPATGTYIVDFPGFSVSETGTVAHVQVIDSSAMQVANTNLTTGDLEIRVFNQAGTLVDSGLEFTVYQINGVGTLSLPYPDLSGDGPSKGMTQREWDRRRLANLAAARSQTSTAPPVNFDVPRP